LLVACSDFLYSFRAFGPLRYARITLEPATGRSRGTGFACFWNKEDADKVVEQSDLLRTETMGNEIVRFFCSPLI
jgi:nucleolar protein 4